MATLKDVAQKAGVTVTTVSRMLNNRVKISEKTRKKIMDAMKELDYQPNELAQSLTKKRSKFIGLIVPSAKNFFFSQVIEYVEKAAVANGYKLLLCVSNLELEKELDYFGMLKANKVAGVIIASHTQNLQEHLNFDAPLLTIDRIISPDIPSVCSDNYHGGELAAEHLISCGCRSLVYLSGSAGLDMDANKRFLGFRDTCKKAGVDSPLFVDASEEFFITMHYETMIEGLFSSHPGIDGVFTSNDIMAAQLVQYLAGQGKRVPDDVKVIGYDDTDLAALCTPPLTTIHQPVQEMCSAAVEYITHAVDAMDAAGTSDDTLASAGSGTSDHTRESAGLGKSLLPRSVIFPVTLVKRGTA